ncbi:hypothetical protein [Aquimarina mytili]|uniref:Uncharacterized protein n=1 Tax=Aquimarina mytili TaxID=874423 RepID=A0A937A2A8_9FLAO|nr:hypothetical protein [Aquimarina mytili]MBL0685576.1 hypothetical protein [Aquimarina mytili]
MRKIQKIFESAIRFSLIELKIDDEIINPFFEYNKVLFAEKIELFFANGDKIILQTEELPHVFGEADIEICKIKKELISDSKNETYFIKKIKTYYWKASGFNLFGLTKFLNQIEIFFSNNYSVSIGFFYLKKEKAEYLATGQLSISFNQNVFKSFNNDNLLEYEILFP